MTIKLPPTPGAPAVELGAPAGTADPIANPSLEVPPADPAASRSQEAKTETGGGSTTPDPKSKTDVETPPRGGGSETPKTQTPEQRRKTLLDQVSTEEWMAHLLAEQDKHGPFEMTKAEIDALPLNARMALATILKEGEKGKAELADTQKKLETTAATARADTEKAAKDRAAALDWINNTGIRDLLEKAKLKPGEAPDPLTEEGAARLVEAKAADFMRQFLGTLEQGQKKAKEEADKLEKKNADDAALAAAEKYADEHADDFADDAFFEEMKTEIRETPGMSVQKAHQTVKNRRLLAALQSRNAPELERARETLKRSRATDNEPPELPAEIEGDVAKVLDFYKRNPGAAKRDNERLRTQGLKV